MSKQSILIYGAYGYTGKLVVDKALEMGYKPILAGRNAQKTTKLGEATNLPYRVFNLEQQDEIESSLKDIAVVVHCAGPFEQTALPMVRACLNTQTHYIDITGEITVFEMLLSHSKEAEEQGIMILPGAGFDVVPTDCMAAFLKQQLPSATHLELGFDSLGGASSRGTTKTAIENLDKRNLVREDGVLTEKPHGHATKWIDFGAGKRHCMSIPWGDVSTAHVSTGIPNIIVYMGIKPSMMKWVKMSNWMRPVLRWQWVKNLLKNRVTNDDQPGPTEKQRAEGSSHVWGQVRDDQGKEVTARLHGPNGYTITAITAMLAAAKVLKGEFKPGFQTPSSAYGVDFVLEVPGTKRTLLSHENVATD